MQWADRMKQVKLALVVAAVLIAAISLVISYLLVRDLSREERNNMLVWAEAMRTLSQADENTDLYLALQVVNGNQTIPVVVLDSAGEVVTYRNIAIDAPTESDSLAYLQREGCRHAPCRLRGRAKPFRCRC